MDIADFCGQLVEAAFDPTGGKAASLMLTTLIRLVLREQEGIDEKLDKLIRSSYKDGLAHLENAKDTFNEQRKRQSIEAATEKFITASNVESPLLAARAKFFVGVCFDLLNDKKLALKWYEKAYETGRAFESKLQKKAKFPPQALISPAYAGYRVYECHKARRELEELQKELLVPLAKVLNVYRVQHIDDLLLQ